MEEREPTTDAPTPDAKPEGDRPDGNRPEASAKPASSATAPEAANGTEFQAVDGGEQTSGAVLLVEAYAAMWLVAFVFVYLGIARQKRLDARIDSIETALANARSDGKKS